MSNDITAESTPEPSVTIGGTTIPARLADTPLAQARGHMFRQSTPDYGLIFPFGSSGFRTLHMVCVPFPLDAVYVTDGEVAKVSRMRSWVGFSWGRADTIIELPAGAYTVEVGDNVTIVPEPDES